MHNLIIQQFIRSRAVVITLVLILVIGIASIFTGKQFLDKEERNIVQIEQHQQAHLQRHVQQNPDNIGGLLYYARFALIHKPDKLTALSIGQRDVNPGVQSVTIRNLEAQKYDTELNNPANQLAGNLDLGFVIIYLFPLVVIAFTFNVQSEESELGTWRLVAVQSGSAGRYLLQKIVARGIVVYAILAALFVIAAAVLPLQFSQALLAFAMLSVVYIAFWFALSFCIVSLQKSSSFNALLLLSVWVILAILLPAAVNNHVANQYPVPEALSTFIKQRDGYHRQWDADKNTTMEKFYAHYPQFRKYTLPADGEFSYTWYYAMQQMGDDEAHEESRAMRKKILQREETSRAWSMAIPTMHTQLLFNDLAGTGLRQHLQFLDHTDAFHEKMRLHFYPKIFGQTPVANENWADLRPEYAQIPRPVNWVMLLAPVLVMTGVLSMLGFFKLRQQRVVP
jgi:ABC-2 type transport system permease protein